MKRRRIAAAVAGFVLLAATSASATLIATSADDICPASTDPCIVSDIVEVTDAATLDFGLRTVRIADGGRLIVTRATILCGSMITDGPDTRTAIEVEADAGSNRSLTVAARKGCSLAPQTPCLDDTVCVRDGLGTCSVGSGLVQLDAKLDADGFDRSTIALRAAGDVVTNAELRLNGQGPEGGAGYLTLMSLQGDVIVNAPIRVHPAGPHPDPDDEYGGSLWPGYPGAVTVDAGRDALFHGPVDLSDGSRGGEIAFYARRDIVIAHDVRRDGLAGWRDSAGGDGQVIAGRNLRVEPRGNASVDTWFTANAGNEFVRYDYGGYGFWEAGEAGDTEITTGGDVVIEDGAHLQANSPLDTCGDGVPYGGEFYIESEGRFLLDGTIDAHAAGQCGSAGRLYVYSETDARLGATSRIDLGGTSAGRIQLRGIGNLVLDGSIDVRADTARYYGTAYGEGGYLDLQGADVEIDGTVLAGGVEGSSDVAVDACRIRLKSDARIINQGGLDPSDTVENYFVFGESFIAERGSVLLADPHGTNTLHPLSGSIDPVLDGKTIPAPLIVPWPGTPWCPTCGNSRLEADETCDDGNLTPGDGCDTNCVNEACVAATAGFPVVTLCDDGSSCTDDRCDPAGTCLHEPSCRDDVACTTETCSGDACLVTSDDSLCDDADPCTADLCQAGSGCLHAARTGESCEDGDLCTLTGTCAAAGGCVASDGVLALSGRLSISLGPNEADDSLSAKVEVEAAELGASPTVTGLRMRLFDSHGGILFDATVPASAFAASANDPRRSHAETTDPDSGAQISIDVRGRAERPGLVKALVRMADFGAASGSPALGLSLLFGENPASDACVAFRSVTCRTARRISCR